MKITGPYPYDPHRHSLDEFFSGNDDVDAFVAEAADDSCEQGFVYVIERGDEPARVVAYLSFQHARGIANIGVIAADMEFQDQGLGVGLIQHALGALPKNNGIRTVEAYCIDSPVFYEKLGFKPKKGSDRNLLQIPLKSLVDNLNRRALRPLRSPSRHGPQSDPSV